MTAPSTIFQFGAFFLVSENRNKTATLRFFRVGSIFSHSWIQNPNLPHRVTYRLERPADYRT
jgi:hypothetical protein